MIKKKRQAQILEILLKEEAITVTVLAELLNVSTVTIRKQANHRPTTVTTEEHIHYRR